jgi:transposase-like protein
MSDQRWVCYHCGKGFVHARFLTSHLISVHNEGAER